MATRDDDFILIYMTLMKTWNPIQDGFVLIWNKNYGVKPDEIHVHWQPLMKGVYGDSIWEPRQLLHSNESAVYEDSIWDPRHIV